MVLISALPATALAEGISVPLRGLWFLSFEYERRRDSHEDNISVPLRGLWFLSVKMLSGSTRTTTRISVPLRGLWFLSGSTCLVSICGCQFPSPCGDYGSYRYKEDVCSNFPPDFRPLAGIMVLINTVSRQVLPLPKPGFPSPCGDYGSYRKRKLGVS